jgi:hypothetical protein
MPIFSNSQDIQQNSDMTKSRLAWLQRIQADIGVVPEPVRQIAEREDHPGLTIGSSIR